MMAVMPMRMPLALAFQRGKRLLCAVDVAGLQVVADLGQGLPKRAVGVGRIAVGALRLSQRVVRLLRAGQIARRDRIRQRQEILLLADLLT